MPLLNDVGRESMERSSVSMVTGVDSEKLDQPSLKSCPYKGEHTPKKSPERDIEGGALVEGGAPELFSRKHIGLVVNYASVGLVYGAFPRTVYPFLMYYLNMESYQLNAATVLVSMPWSFKAFVGIISDSFPIMGYKRRPYMVLGWSFCMLLLVVMSLLPVQDPFYIIGNATPDLPLQFKVILNPFAQEDGAKYIVLMMLAAVGYVVADVAADGLTVEYAMREPESVRGNTQSTIYFVRTIFQMISTVIVAFLFNGKEYGGEFSFSMSFNSLMAVVAVGAFWSIPASIWFIEESKSTRQSFSYRVNQMWRIGQQRAVWQIMMFMFLNSLFYGFNSSASYGVQKNWARVKPLNESIQAVVGNMVFAFSIFLTKKYFLNYDWRKVIFWTTVIVCAIDAVVISITIFDVFRSEWIWLGVPIVEYVPEGMRFIISTLVTVEIAEVGYEAVTYGLLTTVANLATPFATSMYNQIGARFLTTDKDISSDTSEVRLSVFYTFLIMYAFKMASNVFLVLLPRQKKEAQALRAKGGSSRIIAILCFGVIAFALIWSVATNLMSVFKSTSCLKIAGGKGC